MTILGIETSCDDTAAAVLVDADVRSNVISSQHDIHAEFGGVVPELASRNHQRLIVPVVQQALRDADCTADDLDAVAVTYGPGLPGSLMVGLTFAKAFARGRNLPLVGVNHLEGHLYSVDLSSPAPPRPYLCLVVSGGHTELVRVGPNFEHSVLGATRDDAAGEAFDKVAQLLDLGYPGGPAIDRLAKMGDPAFHDFPRSRLDEYDFSFSGLKTSVLYYLRDLGEEKEDVLKDHRADICASFQQAVVDVLVGAVRDAARETGAEHVAIVGGVSANSALRAAIEEAADEDGFEVYMPEMAYCMDNAAMIARAGAMHLQAGHAAGATLDIQPRLRLEKPEGVS
ncbi:tRNA (adenosine(37)-N6)-threonylcarbamoyltransferase complex transferase subunit TsaD [Longibacter salinarum]|uniref:tRNA N6-adenosine threonylcarbamoyltransferase n=1 Tax=Longibacter salinarum TaxID=1850348 RepID=A0A2A8CWZ7_9BACT|nr:tRNA (adenosine(37)-N6)-threonylcarbamoyltransferase complex transferase subunit TsaD [Longibacter salinarum]PEN13225.1 tRNA (adenosine(37)-N6)-threonylcarbamoyltransferase complex transferase subunit TsaD [Longibacter salinarum]